MATAMKSSIKTDGSTGGNSADRALGAAASLGLCLAILRVVGSAYTASRHIENGESKERPSSPHKSTSRTISHFLLSYVRNFLKKYLMEDDVDAFDDDFDDGVDPNPSSTIAHAGSCHCGEVVFEVVAPRRLQARDVVGKIQYRHTKVKTSNFQVFKGQKCLKTYYVRSDNSHDRGAHAFCQQCGVHILYAPWKNSPHLFINVNCLSEGVRRVRSSSAADSVLDTVPADMDNISTVSEVSGDSRWNLFLQHHDSGGSGIHDDVSISDYSYTRKPHQVSLSPSLTAQTELSSNASLVSRLESDDSTVRSFKSVKSARTTGSISLQPLQVQTHHVSPAEQNLSPAMRDQMKKYMSRHLKSEKKIGGEEAKRIQTMKKQTIHAVSRAPVGEHNKYI